MPSKCVPHHNDTTKTKPISVNVAACVSACMPAIPCSRSSALSRDLNECRAATYPLLRLIFTTTLILYLARHSVQYWRLLLVFCEMRFSRFPLKQICSTVNDLAQSIEAINVAQHEKTFIFSQLRIFAVIGGHFKTFKHYLNCYQFTKY